MEGGEGAGKTTQVSRVASILREGGARVVEAREPGGTAAGEDIRRLIKGRTAGLAPTAEVLLFLAARAQLVNEVIIPALATGQIVLLDRFVHSTLAYQGYGLGVDLGAPSPRENIARLRDLCLIATRGLWPRRVFLLDLPVDEGLDRRRRVTPGGDRIEDRDREFHRKVREGYLTLAAAEPKVFVVLDGRSSPDDLAAAIARDVATLL